MPQRIRDYGIAALALAAVFAALSRIDPRVPNRVAQAFSDAVHGRWEQLGTPFGSVVRAVAASPALDNAFVAALLAAGVILVFLMVRT